MNPSMQMRDAAFPVDTVVRVAAIAATAVAVFVLGYSAPVDRALAQDPPPGAESGAVAPTPRGNGPTGYFPDQFEDAARAAAHGEPAETF